jgi:hypothetical protein
MFGDRATWCGAKKAAKLPTAMGINNQHLDIKLLPISIYKVYKYNSYNISPHDPIDILSKLISCLFSCSQR